MLTWTCTKKECWDETAKVFLYDITFILLFKYRCKINGWIQGYTIKIIRIEFGI